jgi:hypothetical protein
MATKPILVEINIQRPIDEVFEYLAHLEKDLQWNPDVISCELVSGEAGLVGAQYNRTQKMLGQEMATTVELTLVEPGKRVEFSVTGGPAKVTGSYDIEQVDEGSHVISMLEAGMMTKYMRPMVTPSLEANLVALKRHIEGTVS